MRKTLLNALKHGSGTILILLTMLLGVSLQAWGDDARGKTIYLVPKISDWTAANATFCLYYYNNSTKEGAFVSMNKVLDDPDDTYAATVPSNVGYVCDYIVFTRKSPDVSTCSWTSGQYWNQTVNLAYSTSYNTFTIKNEKDDGKYKGDWSNVSYCNEPSVATGSSDPDVTATGATLVADVTQAGTNPCDATFVGVRVYSDASCATLVTFSQDTYSDGETELDVIGLTPHNTYYYKAYVTLESGDEILSSRSNFTTDYMDLTLTGPSGSSETYCDGAVIAPLVVEINEDAVDPTYQWYYNTTQSTEGGESILGATSASYIPDQSGYYYCVANATGARASVTSLCSGQITFDDTKTSPVITASATGVTNYTPVTLTATGASISTWTISSGSGVNEYLYKKTGASAVFKGNVGSGSTVTYTVTGTAANDCSSAVNITVNSDSDICQ